MKRLNEAAVNKLYHSNHYARMVLQELAAMPRQDETELQEIEDRISRSGNEITRRELINIFNTLQEYGAGEFIVGRKGRPSRFRWDVDSINVATVDVSYPTPISHAPTTSISSGPVVLITHKYQLRPELEITIQLPADVSGAEAHRLSLFIQSLPFSLDDRQKGF